MDGQSPEHKERLTFCQEEFDFLEEDCALNKGIDEKKISPCSGLLGQ